MIYQFEIYINIKDIIIYSMKYITLLCIINSVVAFVPSSYNFRNYLKNSDLYCNKSVLYNGVLLLKASLDKSKWEPPLGYVPDSQKKSIRWEPPTGYVPKNKIITNKIDKDIEELFDEDTLFSDIKRETEYIDNKFDKLLYDIDHMKKSLENIKQHNKIIHTKSEYYNMD